jgi:hypothetical protein
LSTSNYKIQDNFDIANCIKCGRRPVVSQDGQTWSVLCQNEECQNSIAGKTVNFKAWNEQNKNNSTSLHTKGNPTS